MSSVLSNLSDALATMVEKAAPGVVRVEARRQVAASGIVWSADGVIVTAHHVLEQEDNIKVGLPDGQSVDASLVGRDPTTDLAVLRVGAAGLTAINWSEPDGLRVGHLVLALGRPGRTINATLGVISALGEGWLTPVGGRVDRYVQTDVVMYPGFSGGPLVDAAGQIVGLNSSMLRRGVSITLPAPTVRRTVEALLARGRVSRGYLGIGSQPVRLPSDIAARLGQQTGLILVSVAPGGPAEKSGLLLGDTIVAMGGQAVRSIDDLLIFLSSAQVGSTVPVRVLRGGQVQDLDVVIGENV